VLHTRVRSGALVALSAEVLAIAGAPATDARQARAAVLDVRGPAALSHRSAAAFWGLPGLSLRPLEVTAVRPNRTADTRLARVHTTTCLPDAHVTHVDGLLVTVPVRTLFDLAGHLHPGRVARLVDSAWRMRLVTGQLLRRTLAELAERGRPGIQLMRELIEQRGDGYRPTDSNLEGRFEAIMASTGITSFERQVDVGGIDWAGRVDFIDRTLALVVEIDSDTFHLSLTDRADDEIRRLALEAAGFIVVRVRQFDVWHRPDIACDVVRDGRRRAQARIARSRHD